MTEGKKNGKMLSKIKPRKEKRKKDERKREMGEKRMKIGNEAKASGKKRWK